MNHGILRPMLARAFGLASVVALVAMLLPAAAGVRLTSPVLAKDPTTPSITTVTGGSVALGSDAKLTDTATLAGGDDPTGTITFTLTDSTNALRDTETAAVNGNGDYPTPTGFTPDMAGTWHWVASYGGDSSNNAVSSGATDAPAVVSQASPVVTSQLSATGPVALGASVSDQATLTGATSDAGGTISYGLYSDSACKTLVNDLTSSENAVIAGAAPASNLHLFTSAGTFYFQATYSGDPNNAGPVNSGCTAQTVTDHASVTGTVLGSDGQTPLSGISVWLASNNAWGTSTTTGPDGSYSLAAPAGSYTVRFSDPNGTYLGGCYDPGASDGTNYTASVCTPLDVDADMSLPAVTLPKILRHITGTVSGPSGPLPGISVAAGAGSDLVAFATTISDGTYSLAVPAGNFSVQILAPLNGTYPPGCYDAGASDGSNFTTSAASCTPVPANGTQDATGINMKLPLLLHVTGTVLGSDGQTPLSGISVWLASNNAWGTSTTTGPDGSYSLAAPAGSYTVRFSDPNGTYLGGCYDPGASDGTNYTASVCTPLDVDADMSLPAVTLPKILRHITGKVSGPSGPLPGISVAAGAGSDLVAFATTISDGTYSLAVPAGNFSVQILAPLNGTYPPGCYDAGASDGSNFTTSAASCTPVPANGTQDATGINMKLPLLLHVTGTVLGSDGQTPLSGISVWLASNNAWGTSTTTGPDGSYSLAAPAGSYTVRFSDPNGTYLGGCYDPGASDGTNYTASVCTPLDVDADMSLPAVTLPKILHITGKVTGPDGQTLLQGIYVSALSPDSTTTTTTANGIYSLTVPAGSYTLYFAYPNGAQFGGCYDSAADGNFTTDSSACETVPVGQTDVALHDVTMPRLLHITGTVTGPDGVGLPGISVSADTADYSVSNSTTTADDGTYSLVLPPGAYIVSFVDYGSTYVNGCYDAGLDGNFTTFGVCTPVVVEATQDATGIDVTMPKAPHITGIVLGPDGKPLAGIYVNAVSTDNPWQAAATTGTDGAYSMAVVPADSYTVSFTDSSGANLNGCYDSTADGNFTIDTSACETVPVGQTDVALHDVTTEKALLITGTVTGPDGSPVQWMNVQTGSGGYDASTSTGLDGTYALSVPAGSYLVEFSQWNGPSGCYTSGGFTPDLTACTFVDAGSTDIDVTLPLASQISGIVTGSGGVTLSRVFVTASAPNRFSSTTMTDADGSYSLYVAAGTYTLAFSDWQDSSYRQGCYQSGASGNFTTNLTASANACTPVEAGTPGPSVDVQMSLVGATAAGTNVSVTPASEGGAAGGVTVTFGEVTTAGTTTALVSSDGQPAPSGFRLASSPTYYDISTDAGITGQITTCLPYDPAAYPDPSLVRLLHWNGSSWDDVTSSLDQTDQLVCGTTTSLSPFVVAQLLQKAQTITFGPLPDTTYGAGPIALTATASSGLPTNYSASGQCSVNGSKLTVTAAGTCTVAASQAGGNGWAPASDVSQSFTVKPAPLKITAPSPARTYGSANPTLTPTYSGFVAGDTATSLTTAPTCTTTATTTSGVGTYQVTCSGAVDSNYTVSYAGGTLTVNKAVLTVTAASTTRTYGSANPTLTYSISGFVNTDTSSVVSGAPSLHTTAGTCSSVGSYPITIGAGTLSAANYSFSYVGGTLSVTPAPLTITATSKSKTYGTTLTLGTTSFTTRGLLAGATVTGVTLTSAGSAAGAAVGNYPIVPSAAVGTGLSNYAITYVSGTLTVKPAPH